MAVSQILPSDRCNGFVVRTQSSRRTWTTLAILVSAGLLTRRPDANTFPQHRRVWHSCHTHASCKEMHSFSGSFVRARYKGGSQLRDSWGLSPHSLLIVSFNNKRGEPLRLQNYIKILNYNSTCNFFAPYICEYRIMHRLSRQYLHFSSLKTASWTHKEIFGAKFPSFARAVICCLFSAVYSFRELKCAIF